MKTKLFSLSVTFAIVLQFALIGMQSTGVNGLGVTSLWNENATQPCSITEDNYGMVTLQSSTAGEMCSILISTPPENSITILAPNGVPEEDSLYIERLDDGFECQNRFFAINGLESCQVTFPDETIQVNLQSASALTIKEEKGDASTDETEPQATTDTTCAGSPTSDCSSIEGYDNITLCSYQYSSWSDSMNKCQFGIHTECNVNLYSQEAILDCSETEVLEIRRVLLAFPYPLSTELEVGFWSSVPPKIDVNTLEGLEDIVGLYLEGTQLLEINPEIFKPLQNLKLLNMKFNRLGLGNFREDSFKHVLDLTDLYLSVNMFNSLPAKLLRGMSKLEDIRIDRNNLTAFDVNFFQGLSKLKKMNFNDNSFKSLPVGLFDDLESLELIQFKNCKIAALEKGLFQGLTSLLIINFQNNALKTLPVGIFQGQGLDKLKKFNLRNNEISFIPNGTFHGLPKLDDIGLDYNKLTDLSNGALDNLPTLRLLFLQGNGIKTLDCENNFKNVPILQTLDFGENELETIPEKCFDNLWSKLRKLRLDANKLTKLDENLFNVLGSLRQIDISSNKLDTFPRTDNLTALVYLDATDNPLAKVNGDTLAHFAKGKARLRVSQHIICECFAPDNVRCIAEGEKPATITCGARNG